MSSMSAMQSLSGDAFMKLFIAQMQHQDPTAPLSSDKMIAELAQFTTVSTMNNLTASFGTLLRYEQTDMARDLVGQEVTFTSPETGDEVAGVAEAVEIRDDEVGVLVDGAFVAVDEIRGMRPATAAITG